MNSVFSKILFFILFALTPIMADVPAPGVAMPAYVRKALTLMAQSARQSNLAQMVQRKKENNVARAMGSAATPLSVNIPLLLGRYSDSVNRFSRDAFQNQIFDNNPTGTMIDYYNEISYGQFQLSGGAFGWHKAPQTQKFYVGGESGLGGGGARFARDVAVAADPAVDFSQYDADNDGYVDVIMVVHTGAGAETGESNNIWSHRWSLNAAANSSPGIMPQGEYVTDDPWPGHPGEFVKVNDYIIQPELSGSAGGLIDIGVFCHEFGHAIGLPDLYDTDYSSQGIGRWGLMAGGSYGGDGRHPGSPAHMCAWSKEFLGWIQPRIVSLETLDLSISNIESNSDQSLKVYMNGEPGPEYFLIENRQKIGFDTYLNGDGLLIWHIDQDVIDRKGSSNSINNDERRKGIDLEEADGRADLDFNRSAGDSGDPFPGSTNNTLFNSSSTPNSDSNDGVDSGVAVQIDSCDNQIVTVSFLLTPELSVAPLQRSVAYDAGSLLFSVSNIGGGVMNWSAQSNSDWLAIVGDAAGMNKGEFIVDYDENSSPEIRMGGILVTADGGNQQQILITQSAAGEWTLAMNVMDNGGEQDTLLLGQRFGATEGVDAALGESALSVGPENGVFDVRLQLSDGETASMSDFREPGGNWIQWRLLFQAGAGGFPMQFSWDKNQLPDGSFFLQDEFTGTLIAVDMKSVDHLEVPTSSIKSLKLVYSDVSPQNVVMDAGWNLISVPFQMTDMRPRVLFPEAVSSVYAFDGRYTKSAAFTPGAAYWIKFNDVKTYNLFGPSVSPAEINLRAGWNMIGPFDNSVDVAAIVTTPSGIIASDFYDFSDGYNSASELTPGRGYWVMASQDGKMNLDAVPPVLKPASLQNKENWAALTFMDAQKRSKTLYLTPENVRGFYLPPLPPADAWDVRFEDDRRVRRFGESGRIQIRGAAWPVTVNIANGDGYQIELRSEGDASAQIGLQANGFATIAAAGDFVLESKRLPQHYALMQNFPNPFNPSTTIRFVVPNEEHVIVDVYSARGRLVETLVEKRLTAGEYSLHLDAGSYSSGIYIYQLRAGDFTQTKKMIVLH